MNDQLLQRKAEALGKAVRAGDHASALNLLGEVAAEAERRGYERGRAEAAPAFLGPKGVPEEAVADTTTPVAVPEEGAEAEAPDAGEGAPAEDEHPKRRRKR